MPTYDRELQEAILGAIRDTNGMLRTALADKLWAEIPVPVDEYNYSAALAANTPLSAPAQTAGLELIHCAVVSIPAGATGTLQLGSRVMPLPAGITVLPSIGAILFQNDARIVQSTVAGPHSIWLFGEQRPTYGVLAP